MKKIHVVGLVGLAVAGAMLAGDRLNGQQLSPELLAEVRALRVAIERLATSGARAQVLLGRVQLQEQRISDIARRLAGVHDRIAAEQRESDIMAGVLERVEDRYARSTTPEERTEAERDLGSMKLQAEQLARSIQELTIQETSLAAQLLAEQARWGDFNQKLEELERLLATR